MPSTPRVRVKDHRVTVREVCDFTPWYRRLTMDPEGLFEKYIPPAGGYLLVSVPEENVTVPRAYSIHGVTADHFYLDFVLHNPAGPGSSWAEAAQVGTHVAVSEPPFHLQIPKVTQVLLIADTSALSAAHSIAESLENSQVTLVLVDDHDDRDRLPTLPGLNTLSVGSLTPEVLSSTTSTMASDDCFVWAAGERALTKTVRDFLRNHFRLPREYHHIQTYWIHTA